MIGWQMKPVNDGMVNRQIRTRIERRLLYIFPVPGLVEVWAEAKAGGVVHQPLIRGRLHLNGAICIFRVHRIAPDIQIQRASSEMRTVHYEAGASRTR